VLFKKKEGSWVRERGAERLDQRRRNGGLDLSPPKILRTSRTEATRARILSIYRVHNPRKALDVDALLAEWAGDEEQLLARIEAKYILGTTTRASRSMSTAERTPMVDRQRPMAGRAPSESTLLPGGVPSLSTPPRGVAYRGAHTPSLAKQQAYAPSFDPHDEATATEQQLGKAARKSELQMINDQFLHLYGIQVEGHNKYKDEEHRRKNGENSDPTHGRRNHGTISPEDTFRLTWNIVQAVILIYVAVVVPFRIGFDINLEPFTGGWWFEAGVDLFFILDMGLNFFTGYFDEDDALEMRREKIAAQYLKSWFIIDLVSCLPIQYVLVFMDVEGPEAASHTKILKGLRLFRLAKLLRLGKLRDIFHQYEEEMASLAQAVKFCFYVIIILYSCHLIGCLWFLIGLESARPEDPNWPSNWITNRGIDDKPVEHQYLTSIYWAMTVLTTVGFGDIGPSTPAEMVFSCVAEMAGCFMFAILMGSIAAMITGEQMLKLKVSRPRLRGLAPAAGPNHLALRPRAAVHHLRTHCAREFSG
jgi:hypothetical protein